MPKTNSAAIANLPTAQKNWVEAFLIEYSVEETVEEKRLWQFQYNPSVLRFSGESKWNAVETFAAREADQQFGSSTGLTLEIPNIYLDTFCLGKSLKPLLDGLDELRKADIRQSKFNPTILSFVFGSRRFSPCVLTRLNWDEVAWLGGEPARVQLSMTLQQLPIPGKLGLAAIAPELQLPPEGLTERQRGEGSEAAKKWLTDNAQTLSPDVQNLVRSNGYKLSTDADGKVTMTNAAGQAIGILGTWDGSQLDTSGSTIPKASSSSNTSPVAGFMGFQTTR